MEVKISKKSYYLPDLLVVFFKKWCKPGRDYSPKVAGAIFYYMQLPPDIREACEKAAYSDSIENAIKKLSPAMKPDCLDKIRAYVDDLNAQAKYSGINSFDSDIICSELAELVGQRGESSESSTTECIEMVQDFATRYKIPDKAQQQLIASIRKLHGPDPEDPAVDAARIASDAERGAKQLNKKDRGVRESRAKAQ